MWGLLQHSLPCSQNAAENVTYIPPRINIVLKDTGPTVCVAAMAHHTPVVG
jgi:hypothetical protein